MTGMEYFTIEELTRSDTAASKGIANKPTAQHLAALEALVENVLDPLRRAWGKPIRVSSGYRSQALNKAVGGVATSQHCKGEAADVTAGSKTENKRLFELAIKMDLPYDQIIDEYGYRWLHISYSLGYCRHKIIHIS